MRIHIRDIWRSNVWGVYVVYVWTWSKCEDGIKYIHSDMLLACCALWRGVEMVSLRVTPRWRGKEMVSLRVTPRWRAMEMV
jgi:hypothetical protein